ncbi:MAG: LysM peptidoglycan-binding domain-containing protein [Labilithrix sp.]|nr:LysM peptidoglycan-binding domain-containing protein [Labilithrix sp.]
MSFVFSPRTIPSIALGLLLPIAHVTVAFAQAGPPPPGGGGGGGAAPGGGGGGGGGGAPGGGASGGSVTSSTTFFPGGVAPPPPGGVLGGGNAQFSSSKPITGNERDSFDFKRGGSTSTVFGNEGSSFVLGDVKGSAGNANFHLVRKGDTLWAICDFYFRNPYQWPRIWSFNPQIQNPHWIFPGDQVRLRQGGFLEPTATPGSPIVDRRRQVPPDTIFLRTQGYIDDDTNNWGEINGSREDKMILSDTDEVYLRIGASHDLKVGQELTVFRPVRSVGSGKLIEIQGTVKVEEWNPRDRIARARITESLDAIERGARVGPVARRFEVVPPVRNDKDVTATVLTSVHPHNFFGQNQIVFLDQGDEAGLKPGNRLFVIKKGDAYHHSLTTTSSAKRIALEDDSPAATENIPKPRNEQRLPEDVQAELRIINVRKQTAMAIVTNSRREIESGDKAFARRGY